MCLATLLSMARCTGRAPLLCQPNEAKSHSRAMCAGRGGFLTGWIGQCVFAAAVVVVGLLFATGILGSLNSDPTLQKASTEFINARASALRSCLLELCSALLTSVRTAPCLPILRLYRTRSSGCKHSEPEVPKASSVCPTGLSRR